MASEPFDEEIAQTISLADEEGVRRVIVETLFGLWATVNNLSRLRPSSRERYRVTVFGSARAQPGTWAYEEVRRMCVGLGEIGCDIVTGGGPGLMEAANRGAAEGDRLSVSDSIGIRVHLPFEQNANPFVEQVFEHETFFTRLHQFVLMSDAYIVVPGGIGTLLEATMIWQLLQVRQLAVPLVFAGPMWRGLVDWTQAQMLRPGFELASPQDLSIPICVDSVDDAVAIIRDRRQEWLDERAASVSAQGGNAR